MRHKWTLARCMWHAEQFRTLADWRRGSNLSYQAARRNGWLADCTDHMKKPVRMFPSPSEIRALEILADAGRGRITLQDVAQILGIRLSVVRSIMRGGA